ncbi:hypothetical protein C8D77_11917 [Mesorhizobium loti]|uniref:HNH endonuclease n=2 Tax=Rhizobium loti TaxID=381 RepID=A0A8E2W664_RHILI|nr:hypothetical protein C8D77_11917 [Mesorhizobium loti]
MVSLSKKIRSKQPHCIYCGGLVLGDSVDHVPPKGLFDGAWRPKGGEVTACKECHAGTREMDDVAGFLSRIFPNPQTDEQRDDVVRSIASLARNYPRLVEELGPPEPADEHAAGAATFVANGPILSSIMATFGARIGFALHYRLTGEIIGPAGGAFVNWYSNAQRFEGNLPQEFLATLGPDYTMSQGRKNVEGQFAFAFASSPDGVTAYWATFRQSFAIAAFVSQSAANFAAAHPDYVARPGFLLGYSVKHLGSWPGINGVPFYRPYVVKRSWNGAA